MEHQDERIGVELAEERGLQRQGLDMGGDSPPEVRLHFQHPMQRILVLSSDKGRQEALFLTSRPLVSAFRRASEP